MSQYIDIESGDGEGPVERRSVDWSGLLTVALSKNQAQIISESLQFFIEGCNDSIEEMADAADAQLVVDDLQETFGI